jgi:hypothetical protein
MIKGRKVYNSFDEAKAYVLHAREELRKTWDARVKAAADETEVPVPTRSHATAARAARA